MRILIQSNRSGGARKVVCGLRDAGHDAVIRSPSSLSGVRRTSRVVNWGCTGGNSTPALNGYSAVGAAVDKLETFSLLKAAGIRTPEYVCHHTPDMEVSNTTDSIWFARSTMSGSGGRGITVVRPGDLWPLGQTYVRYIQKAIELRGHVVGDEVMLRQKLRPSGLDMTNDQHMIRSGGNGWVFGHPRLDQDASELAAEFAIECVRSLNLDFGAVDFIIGRDDEEFYALEVNTAPGVRSEATAQFYTNGIIKLLEKRYGS